MARNSEGRPRGAKRMRALGYKLVQVWLDAKEAAAIEEAARWAGKPLATWIREIAASAAQQVQARPVAYNPSTGRVEKVDPETR